MFFELMLSSGIGAAHRPTVFPDKMFPDVKVKLVTEITEEKLKQLIARLDDASFIENTFSRL